MHGALVPRNREDAKSVQLLRCACIKMARPLREAEASHPVPLEPPTSAPRNTERPAGLNLLPRNPQEPHVRNHLFSFALVCGLAFGATPGRAQDPPAPPKGFVTKDAQPERPESVELDAASVARHSAVIAKLVVALENEDVKAFEGLMTPRLVEKHRAAHDPLSGLVDFMARVMADRGGFSRFHQLGDSARKLPDSAFPMLPAIFHLQDGTSGYIGIALDEHDKVDLFSLIVKEDICALGAACDRPAHEFAEAGHE